MKEIKRDVASYKNRIHTGEHFEMKKQLELMR
jgi:hypothetical protein